MRDTWFEPDSLSVTLLVMSPVVAILLYVLICRPA